MPLNIAALHDEDASGQWIPDKGGSSDGGSTYVSPSVSSTSSSSYRPSPRVQFR